MKFCADENVSPVLTALIRETLVGRGHTFDTVDTFQARGVEDQIWLRKFADAGGEAVIGADGRMMTRPHEIVAIAETGVRLAVLPSQWVNSRKHLQIAFLFLWWPRVESALVAAPPGGCFKVPWAWNEESEVRPWTLDVEKAYRAAGKG